MAILLKKMTDRGANAEYWVVSNFNLQKNEDDVNISFTLSGYISKNL
jgi:hypothetical protein